MNSYLVQTANPDDYYPVGDDPMEFTAIIRTGTLGTDTVLDIVNPADPTKSGDTLIGGRDPEGMHVAPFDLARYDAIRPLANGPEYLDGDGNTVRAGLATPQLKYHKVQGWVDWHVGDEGLRYPDSTPPYFCECRLMLRPDHEDQWAPRFEVSLENEDVERNPSLRNFRIFSSPDCIFPGEFLYQLGALQYGDSLWHVDEEGAPFKVWFSESNQYTVGPQEINFALYWSEYEEGRFTLPVDAPSVRRLFWGANTQSNRNILGPFPIDTNDDGTPDMAFELHIKARMVYIYVNSDPKPELKIKYANVDREVDNPQLRAAILGKIGHMI